MKKISVVTVVYNSVHNVEETLLNVIGQTWGNLEYIVIDGGSTDGTVDVIKKYTDKITFWISEKDKGIFDAMNKSLQYVTGEYVLFMNAGDTFVSHSTVENVFSQDVSDADLIYGDTYVLNHLGYKLGKADAIYSHNPSPQAMVFLSQGFCHQSLFTKTEVLKTIRFNTKYPIGADYDTTAKVYFKGNHKLHYVGFPVAVFDDRTGGASHYKIKKMYQERYAMFDYKPTLLDKLVVEKQNLEHKFKTFMEKLFPTIVKNKRKRNYIETIPND